MLLKSTNYKKISQNSGREIQAKWNHHKSSINFKVIIERDGKTIHPLGSCKDHNYYNKANMPVW